MNEEKRLEILDEARESSLKLNHMMEDSSITDILELGLEEGLRLTESKVGFLHFIGKDCELIELQVWSKETGKQCYVLGKEDHYPISEAGVWGDCVRQRRPVFHNDYMAFTDKKGLPKGHVPIIRYLSVPVFQESDIVPCWEWAIKTGIMNNSISTSWALSPKICGSLSAVREPKML